MGCGILNQDKEARFTAEYLRSKFCYNPETGVITWRVRSGRGKMKPGDVAGYALGGKYWLNSLDGEHFYGHRLAWILQTGGWPKGEVDHKDLNGLNNKWTNLREATRAQNVVNRRALSTNLLGVKGVSRVKKTGKFIALISVGGSTWGLGTFKTAEEANAAYEAAAKGLHGEFARAK